MISEACGKLMKKWTLVSPSLPKQIPELKYLEDIFCFLLIICCNVQPSLNLNLTGQEVKGDYIINFGTLAANRDRAQWAEFRNSLHRRSYYNFKLFYFSYVLVEPLVW